MSFWSKIYLFAAVNVLLAGSAASVTAANDSQALPVDVSSRLAASSGTLPDGLYLVLREADNQEKLKPTTRTEHVIIYDYHFLEPAQRGTPSYLTVSAEAFIPIALSGEPIKEKDSRGRPKLLLQLAKNQVVPLEEFTRKNCGRSVAILIGGQVVTMHKIREPITGGRMQITRCTDNGCDVLYSKLQGN